MPGITNVISHRFSCFNSGHELDKGENFVTRACGAVSLGLGNEGETHVDLCVDLGTSNFPT